MAISNEVDWDQMNQNRKLIPRPRSTVQLQCSLAPGCPRTTPKFQLILDGHLLVLSFPYKVTSLVM